MCAAYGWSSLDASRASRRKRATYSAELADGASGTLITASRPSSGCSARYTSAEPPRPSRSTMANLPSVRPTRSVLCAGAGSSPTAEPAIDCDCECACCEASAPWAADSASELDCDSEVGSLLPGRISV
jgi:hypothetical protein